MKRSIPALLLLWINLCFISCVDDEDIVLTLEKATIVFNSYKAQEKAVAFTTNAVSVSVEVIPADQEWCQARIEKQEIIISVSENTSYEDSRSTTVIVTAEGAYSQVIKVTQPSRTWIWQPALYSFVLPADINGLKKNIEAIIDNDNLTITIASKEWISNVKNLIVLIDSPGEAYIGETKQISEITSNSFLEKLTYRIFSEDGNNYADYEVRTEGPMFTGLPVMSVDINDGLEVVEKTVKLPAVFHLVDPDNETFDMSETDITIRGRGNSSWFHPKKPYRIDFLSKTSVFGLTKAKKWILLSNYQDASLIMNDVAFELGRRFGMQYTHSSTHVELFINGTYRGNYLFTEQKEIGKGRVDVDETDGFLVEIDSYYDEEYKFRSNHLDLPIMVAGPDLNSEDEMEYIRKEIQGLEDALFEKDFPNNSYENYTDAASLINFMLINEITGNRELWYPKSCYCYKDTDTKIMWGPLWDFDWAFGYNETNAYFKNNSRIFPREYTGQSTGMKFFCRFFMIPEFRAKYKARWKEMKPKVTDIVNYIDVMGAKLDKSQAENFQLEIATPNTLNVPYKELLTQMKNWLTTRVEAFDMEIEGY